ncbi:hypothetical protein [Nocardia terpenica]|uniref:hypothetical protein n=1 Tax=Nocardia terpenica TaxID=455432 RepID=UPI000AEEFCC0|nr:hypothetical protein [Nocardia terpenica]NQE86274.1 hypothetical protein [Nocardia terpenica]
MNRLQLRPEIQCYPIWVFRDGMFNNVEPSSLGLSSDLANALERWADRWDATYDLVNDPGNPHFDTDADENRFWEDGRELADRLRAELGDGWGVELELPK